MFGQDWLDQKGSLWERSQGLESLIGTQTTSAVTRKDGAEFNRTLSRIRLVLLFVQPRVAAPDPRC
jgi:hypothetical protein